MPALSRSTRIIILLVLDSAFLLTELAVGAPRSAPLRTRADKAQASASARSRSSRMRSTC
jgi:hypothetical protein